MTLSQHEKAFSPELSKFTFDNSSMRSRLAERTKRALSKVQLSQKAIC